MARADTRHIRIIRNETDILGLSILVPTPYDSNPSAKEHLEEIHRKLLCQIGTLNGRIVKRLKSCLAAVCYQLGRIYYDTGDKSGLAESMFLKATSIVKKHESKADNILSVISCLNMMGFINMKNKGNYEEALRYLLEAQRVYENYNESKSGPPTHVNLLLPMQCPKDKLLITNKNPLVGARLFTLFYIIDAYKNRGMIDEAVISTHHTLKLQLENQLFLQSPLDWAQSSAVISNFLTRQNAYKQARHHLAAASTFIETIIPKNYAHLYSSATFQQYTADIARCWSTYGFELLKKSKTIYLKEKTYGQTPAIFNDLFFKNFKILNEEKVTYHCVNNYEDAVSLGNNILMNLNRTKKFYTLEKFPKYYADLCIDELITHQLLADFQTDRDKKGKLYKKGIVDMELTVNRLDEKDCRDVCKHLWFDLATMYYHMMEIKYDRHVKNRPELTQCAAKTINHYSDSCIKYYTKLVETFCIDGKLEPKCIIDADLKPAVMAHINMGKCYDRKIVYSKNIKLDNLLQSQKKYKIIVDYSRVDPRLISLCPLEMRGCDVIARRIPARIDELFKNKDPVKFY